MGECAGVWLTMRTQLALEAALGCTAATAASFAVDWQSSAVAYAAGAVVVVHNPLTNQALTFRHASAKPIAAVQFSIDGRWLAAAQVPLLRPMASLAR